MSIYRIIGQTALIIASRKGYSNIVGLLLKHSGIDITKEDNSGKTALMLAPKKSTEIRYRLEKSLNLRNLIFMKEREGTTFGGATLIKDRDIRRLVASWF